MTDRYEKEVFRQYPRLVVDLGKLRNNVRHIVGICREAGIEAAGVVKGANGLVPVMQVFAEEGVKQIASSRLEHLAAAKESVRLQTEEQTEAADGAEAVPETLLVRIAMLSEVPALVRYADMSLESEWTVLEAIEREAAAQGKTHSVILMADLGDLREGYWDKDEMVETAVRIEQELPHVELAGVGTNLGCYGAICPDEEKMNDLIAVAAGIEERIGRKLRYVSGGATTSLPLVLAGTMPAGINHLRVGEAIISDYDLPNLWGIDMSAMYDDVFTLEAEVIEVKRKPTHPIGRIFVDCFGDTPVYEDRGIRCRALLGMGKLDYTMIDKLYPKTEGIELVGDSSDHAIIDVEECKEEIKVGDVLTFDLAYPPIMYLTQDRYINIVYTGD